MMFRHGLRVSEAIGILRNDVDLEHARLWVRRLKHGLDVEHPIPGDKLRAMKRFTASRTDALRWLFISERRQLAPDCRQCIRTCYASHSRGFALANRGYDLRLIQDYLGHGDPKHTVHYTRVAAGRFEDLWR